MKLGQPMKAIIDMHAEVCTIQTMEDILSRSFEIESHVFIRTLIIITATCFIGRPTHYRVATT
jgi:hypothetical protein